MRPLLRAGALLVVLASLAAADVATSGHPTPRTAAPWPVGPRTTRPTIDPSQIACSGPRRFDALLNQTGPFCVPKDEIPAIDDPTFRRASRARIPPAEPVVAVEVGRESRAYPVRILLFHEIVNDEVAGQPVVVTFCPLCNAAVAFSRRAGPRTLTFGVSGQLNFANLVMFDRETDSRWQQQTGRAYSGTLEGTRLELVPAQLVSFGRWRAEHPAGLVMRAPENSPFPYGRDAYFWYDKGPAQESVVVRGERIDPRLPPKWRVVGVALRTGAVAFAEPGGSAGPAVAEARLGSERLVAFFERGPAEAERAYFLEDGPRGWAGSVWRARLDGRPLSFHVRGGSIVERTTGSRFDLFGRGLDGPLAGRRLDVVPSSTSFWFSWWHFFPDTSVVRPARSRRA